MKDLGIDTPFPLSETLRLLVEWMKHLHHDHECDCHGWEQRSFLIEAAERYRNEITGEKILADQKQTTMDWKEVLRRLQAGSKLVGWLDWDGDSAAPGYPALRWKIDDTEIPNGWQHGLPFDLIRSSPGGHRQPFVAYLTDYGRVFGRTAP